MKNKQYPVLFENEYACCGCSACEAVCPADVIKLTLCADGFYYPLIDYDKCICCFMCKKVCKHTPEI